jgi:hypothetical protein
MRRYLAWIFYAAAAIWPLRWEVVRAWFLEQGFHLVNPYLFGIVTGDQILHWGPSLAFVAMGSWLFYKTRPRTQDEQQLPQAGEKPGHFEETKRSVERPDALVAEFGRSEAEPLVEQPAKPKRTRYENRRLLDVSPESLMDIYKDKTPMQGDAVAKEVQGKWFEYTGAVFYVDDHSVGSLIQYYVVFKHYLKPDYYAVISAIFDDTKWKGRLLLLSRGQKITVIGKILRIGTNTISLEKCEIVE